MELENDLTEQEEPQIGNRFSNDGEDVFKHNAWDNVELDEEQEQNARASVEKNSNVAVTEEQLPKFEKGAKHFGDIFTDLLYFAFVKEESRPWGMRDSGNKRIFNPGCGAGDTILFLLKHCLDEVSKIYGCDISSKAIEDLRKDSLFDSKRGEVFVMDITDSNWKVPFEENSIDIIYMYYLLSLIHPDKLKIVAENCFKYLKPGGMVSVREYGRRDNGKCLRENFFVRADGKKIYVSTKEEMKDLFEGVGLVDCTRPAN